MGRSELQTPATSASQGAIAGMDCSENEYSYTRNSKLQARAIELHLKHVLEAEIRQLRFFNVEGEKEGVVINVADLGCSVGDNTLRCAQLVLETLKQTRSREIQYFFSDLPTNDFNTLFRQLENWKTNNGDGVQFYSAGVPGSFFNRLFPPRSLHIVISTFSAHYLSKVPDGSTDKASPAYNKHRVWIHKAPPAVVDAYAQQSKHNLFQFFSCRAQEVASGGLVVLYFPARVNEEHPEVQFEPHLEEFSSLGTIFEEAWKSLVTEGTISEEEWNSLNIPFFAASMGEVRAAVTATDAFHIKQMQVEELHYFEDQAQVKQLQSDPEAFGLFYSRFIEGVLRPYFENHIGKESGEKFFQRLMQLGAKAAQQKGTIWLALNCMLVVLIRK